ncbi:MAG: aminotransferase class V-fold PLP-dependent enzyme [Thermoanaerobaculia bacterium]|nr:aminotransferase class V-fold PLP-dependent enzyme [Thermoanaerobaculia bacterium]
MTRAFPLEPSDEELRRLLDDAVRRVALHIGSLSSQPADGTAGAEGAGALARSLIEREAPEDPTPAGPLLDLLFEKAIPASFNNAGPGFLAYVPGGGQPYAAVADLISSAVNRYVGVFAPAPALVQLETNVIRWLARAVGYPESAGGFLTSGGSLANFSAVVAARHEKLPENFLKGTLYVSDQGHHCIRKAALLAGFPDANVREIPSDAAFRMRLDALANRVAADRAEGFTPFLVAASAGTVNTGAVDDLDALADFAGRENLWLHTDAAYGGFFALTSRGRAAMSGLQRADSIVLDPHKGLFMPYGTGSLLVKDPAALRRSHSVRAHYMPGMQDDPDCVDFCEISPELSRNFRGLAVWLAVKLCGLAAFRASLDEKLDLAREAVEAVREIPGMTIVAEPELSLFAFRLTVPGASRAETNRLNRDLLDRVNARQRVFLTGTLLGEDFAIRMCILSFRTHADRVHMALEDLRGAAQEIAHAAPKE